MLQSIDTSVLLLYPEVDKMNPHGAREDQPVTIARTQENSLSPLLNHYPKTN